MAKINGHGKPCVNPIDAEVLAAWLENNVGEFEREQIEEHLAQCDDCRGLAVRVFKDLEQEKAREKQKLTQAPPLPKSSQDEIRRGEESYHLRPQSAKDAERRFLIFAIIVIVVSLICLWFVW